MAYGSNPYIDFSYGSYQTSDFHLYRTSSGSRYNTNLIPTLTEKTAEVPGADGMYFFNSYYKQRQFTIDLAFDEVTENNLRNIRNWLNGKDIRRLVFDESYDRYYNAKVTGAPSFKYIPFDEATNANNLSFNTNRTSKVYRLKRQPINFSPFTDTYSLPNGEVCTINGKIFSTIIFVSPTTSITYNNIQYENDLSNQQIFFVNTSNVTVGHFKWSKLNNYELNQSKSNPFLILTDTVKNELNNTNYASLIDLARNEVVTIYKGEGSVQFTCYDPFAYSKKRYIVDPSLTDADGDVSTNTSETKMNSYSQKRGQKVNGTVEPTFICTIKSQSSAITINANSFLAFGQYTSSNEYTSLATITFLEEVKTPITWDSKTGLIIGTFDGPSNTTIQRPVRFTGKSYCTLPLTTNGYDHIVFQTYGAGNVVNIANIETLLEFRYTYL